MPSYYQKIISDWRKLKLQGIDGKGVSIAHLDSGNEGTKDFFVNFTADPNFDVSGHGTLTASILKSSIGIAYGCTLYSLKVVDDIGGITATSVLNALQYCIDNSIDFITMSFTCPFTVSQSIIP